LIICDQNSEGFRFFGMGFVFFLSRPNNVHVGVFFSYIYTV